MSRIVILPGSWNKVKDAAKGSLDVRKAVKDVLVDLNVAVADECCIPDETIQPVAFDAETGVLNTFNGTEWVPAETEEFSADVIAESTAAAGVTVDGVLLKDGGVSANSMKAAFYPQVVQNNIAAAAGGAIAVTNYLTTINTDAGGDAFTLANGTQIGQMKKILLVVDGGGDATITPATALAGGTTITMGDAGDYVILQWSGTAWVVLENSGSAIA